MEERRRGGMEAWRHGGDKARRHGKLRTGVRVGMQYVIGVSARPPSHPSRILCSLGGN